MEQPVARGPGVAQLEKRTEGVLAAEETSRLAWAFTKVSVSKKTEPRRVHVHPVLKAEVCGDQHQAAGPGSLITRS